MLWLTIIVFIVILLTLVLVHELGHFITAKRAGCRVEEFAFGFPPRLFSKTIGETTYSFNLLPLGGYVKIEGENMDEINPGPKSFSSKSVPARLMILVAGVAMNFLLTVVLLSVQAGIGVPTLATSENKSQMRDLYTYIVDISPDSPAAEAGLKKLDRIVRLSDTNQPSLEQVQAIIANHTGRELAILTEQGGKTNTITVTPRTNPPAGEGPVGIALQEVGLLAEPWWKAPVAGITRTWQMTLAITDQFKSLLYRLFSQGIVSETVTGPIGIAFYANEVTNMGLSYIIEFAALISLNLALINIMPIPALDGGRVLFVLFEGLFGKRLPNKIEQVSHLTGFVLLIILMLLVTFKDIKQFI